MLMTLAKTSYSMLYYVTMGDRIDDTTPSTLTPMMTKKTPTPRPPVESEWLTAEEVAQQVRASLYLVYRAAKSGRLKAVRLGGGRTMWRFKQAWVNDWLYAQTWQPGRKGSGDAREDDTDDAIPPDDPDAEA